MKLIGVFSTEALAREALDRVRSQPGFRDWPDGFSIDCFLLDRVEWSEGFVTLEPGEE